MSDSYCCFKMKYNLTHPEATLYGVLYRSEYGWTGIASKGDSRGFEILDWCPWCKAHLPDRVYPPVPEGKSRCTWNLYVICPFPEGTMVKDCAKDCPLDEARPLSNRCITCRNPTLLRTPDGRCPECSKEART